MRELRFMERPVYVPPSYTASTVEIRTPLFNDLVQRLAGALSINPPQIKVPPRPKGDASANQRLSSKLEKWTTAFLGQIEHQENDRLYYRFLDYLCGDGHAVMKLVHREDFWDGYPTLEEYKNDNTAYQRARDNFKTDAPLPFSLKVLDPLTVYPRWSEKGLEEVLEVTKRPKIYVAKRFNVGAWGQDGSPLIGQNFAVDAQINMSGECEFWERWDHEYVEFYINGKLVDYKEHGYKRVPYFIALGTQTSSSNPAHEGLSVGHQLKHLIPALDSLLTMKTNSAFLTAYPTFKRERDMGAPGRRASDTEAEEDDGGAAGEEFEPGHIYEGLPGERLEVVQLPPVGKDLDESIQIIMGIIGKVGVPSVLEGMHSPNRVSGYAYSEMLNVSRTKYTTIIRNASFAYEQMIQFLWWLIEKRVMDEVPIWGDDGEKETWLELGPSDVNGYRAVKVIIEPLLPEDDIAQGQHAAAMVQAGMWSTRYARESKMGIPDPEAMDDEILVEQAMKMPQVQMYLLMKALERLEMDEMAEILQLSSEMVQQQLIDAVQGQQGAPAGDPGQAGMPNMEPGTGSPGAPMPGANGMMNGGSPGGGPQPPGMSPV